MNSNSRMKITDKFIELVNEFAEYRFEQQYDHARSHGDVQQAERDKIVFIRSKTKEIKEFLAELS